MVREGPRGQMVVFQLELSPGAESCLILERWVAESEEKVRKQMMASRPVNKQKRGGLGASADMNGLVLGFPW